MRILFIIFVCFTGILARAESLTFLQLINMPSKNVTLESYLKLTERQPINNLGDSLKSVRVIRSMEKLNLKNLKSKSNLEKVQNIKSRIDFLSKPMGTIRLSIAETLIHLVELQEYYNLSYELKNVELNNWVKENKVELVAKKQKILEMMLTHDFDLLRASYDEMTAINENPSSKKGNTENLSPHEIQKRIAELEKMKAVFKNNQDCLYSSSCYYCGLSVSSKPCAADTQGRVNKILPERFNEAILNFNSRFEKLTKQI